MKLRKKYVDLGPRREVVGQVIASSAFSTFGLATRCKTGDYWDGIGCLKFAPGCEISASESIILVVVRAFFG